VSTNGGAQPRWSHDGRALFFRNVNELLKADITIQPSFQSGKPVVLFEGRFRQVGGVAGYDVARDGRFLLVKDEFDTPPTLNVVINWAAEVRRALTSSVSR
jgi:hypothetical protein